ENIGSAFNEQGAAVFNDFIFDSGLIDIQLGGYSFTWSHPPASKMSKLDRFLLTEGLISLFPHLSAICLNRHLSDHRPILLREVDADYGAIPFRFYHSWFNLNGFEHMVSNTWKSTVLSDRNRMVRFKKKLQILKNAIRLWVTNHKRNQLGRLSDIKSKLTGIDIQLDNGEINLYDILLIRVQFDETNARHQVFYARDSFQKAKIKWAIEGDENSKFFHDSDRAVELESPVTCDEIRKAVWTCRENKSPGPDGFTFEFFPLIPKVPDPKFVNDFRSISLIGCLYKVITKILAMRLSMVISDLISDVQTAFLPKRQILDGPFIINELLSWCKCKKKQAMVFKVDFAKSTLSSGMASILINGSPTSEFEFHCGLKQGDPLAPFLFILVMESLHLSFTRVVEAGIFRGSWVGVPMSMVKGNGMRGVTSSNGCGVPDPNITHLWFLSSLLCNSSHIQQSSSLLS
ncbi:RNA-directed DNA polymerase, eukaryota, partial [Tanacetum coccineum]